MRQNTPVTSAKDLAQSKYASARVNLRLMIVLTLVNIVLLFTEANMMMLFSATIPYFLVALGIELSFETGLPLFTIVTCVIAAITLLVYLLCWIFSKRRYAWMLIATILFGIDTLFLLFLVIDTGEISSILDIVFHGLVMYYLIMGVVYGKRLKAMPAEDPEAAAQAPAANESPLRRAEEDVKHRVLLEEYASGMQICYRRVKRVNELVVNNYVYDELEMLVEPPHTLRASVNGHLIEAGTDSASRSFLRVDGEVIKQKVRLV